MGFNIAEKRRAQNMTQEELSKKAGVSRATIASLESGAKTVATSKTILLLAKALNCSVEEIFFTDVV